MSDAPPKDVPDMLDALAKRIRADPAFRLAAAARPETPLGIGTAVEVDEESSGPRLGAIDVFTDERAVTVTIETRNADAKSVHVTVSGGRLMVDLGEGPDASKKDVALPAAVDEEAAFATFRNGVLDVVLPLRGSVRGR